jgi:hypothetical protein
MRTARSRQDNRSQQTRSLWPGDKRPTAYVTAEKKCFLECHGRECGEQLKYKNGVGGIGWEEWGLVQEALRK